MEALPGVVILSKFQWITPSPFRYTFVISLRDMAPAFPNELKHGDCFMS